MVTVDSYHKPFSESVQFIVFFVVQQIGRSGNRNFCDPFDLDISVKTIDVLKGLDQSATVILILKELLFEK